MSFSLLKFNTTNTHEKSYLILLSMIWGNVIIGFVKGFVNTRLTFIEPLNEWGVDIAIWIVALLAIPHLRKYISVGDVLGYMLVVLYYYSNYYFYPENSKPLDYFAYYSLYLAVPMYFIGKSIDIVKSLELLHKISIACIYTSALYYLFFVQSSGYSGSAEVGGIYHNMTASYELLPHVLLVMYKVFKKVDIFNLSTLLLGFLLIFSFGTRGPLICALFFASVLIFFVRKFKHPVIPRTVVIFISLVIYLFLNPILVFMVGFTKSLGMSPRIFEFMIDGTMVGGESSSDARLDYIDICYDKMENMPFAGYGLEGAQSFLGTYPHNIWLEFLISFGYVIGVSLMLFLVFIIARKFFTLKIEYRKAFCLILICSGFIPCFLSGTFITNQMLFLLIGYCFNVPDAINHICKI